MKKMVSLLLIVVFAVGLSACAGDGAAGMSAVVFRVLDGDTFDPELDRPTYYGIEDWFGRYEQDAFFFTPFKSEKDVDIFGKTYRAVYWHSLIRPYSLEPADMYSLYDRDSGKSVGEAYYCDGELTKASVFTYENHTPLLTWDELSAETSSKDRNEAAELFARKYIDTKNYTLTKYEDYYEDYYVYRKYIGDVQTVEYLKLCIDHEGNLLSFDTLMLHEFDHLDNDPAAEKKAKRLSSESAERLVAAKLEKIMPGYDESRIINKYVVLLTDGDIGIMYENVIRKKGGDGKSEVKSVSVFLSE